MWIALGLPACLALFVGRRHAESEPRPEAHRAPAGTPVLGRRSAVRAFDGRVAGATDLRRQRGAALSSTAMRSFRPCSPQSARPATQRHLRDLHLLVRVDRTRVRRGRLSPALAKRRVIRDHRAARLAPRSAKMDEQPLRDMTDAGVARLRAIHKPHWAHLARFNNLTAHTESYWSSTGRIGFTGGVGIARDLWQGNARRPRALAAGYAIFGSRDPSSRRCTSRVRRQLRIKSSGSVLHGEMYFEGGAHGRAARPDVRQLTGDRRQEACRS